MSRIGKLPISLPKGVTASVAGREVKVKGPKGELKLTLAQEVTASEESGQLLVKPVDDSKRAEAVPFIFFDPAVGIACAETDGDDVLPGKQMLVQRTMIHS